MPGKPDLVIAGGGVAGSTLAYEAARRGFKVVFYDRAPVYRKACGDAVTLRPMVEELVEETGSVLTRVRRFQAAVNGDTIAEVTIKPAPWVIVDKTALVNGLREMAVSEGAEFKPVDWRGERGEYTVDARGPYSWGLKREYTVYVYRWIAEAPGSWEPDRILLDFDLERLGFFWVFPASDDGNRVNIGGGFYRVWKLGGVKRELGDYARRLLGDYRVLDERGAPIAVKAPIDLGSDSMLRVGEAAGLILSTAGEGNRPGIMSAMALAEALARGEAAGGYKRRVSRLLSEVKTSRILLSMVETGGGMERVFRGLPEWFWREYFTSNITLSTLVRVLASRPGLLGKALRALSASRILIGRPL